MLKKCLEIGTFTGFSASTIALALPKDGKLITLDIDEKIAQVAINFFKKGNLDRKIETVVAPALDTLKKIKEEKKTF